MKYIFRFFLLIGLFLSACSGSDIYKGNWKATDGQGNKFEITFDSKTFTVEDSLGKAVKFKYTQHSVEISNSVRTYGIKLEDGRTYAIKFPISDNKTIAVMLLDNNDVLYTLSRKGYLRYEDLYKLSE